jgi:hypothetical protein
MEVQRRRDCVAKKKKPMDIYPHRSILFQKLWLPFIACVRQQQDGEEPSFVISN